MIIHFLILKLWLLQTCHLSLTCKLIIREQISHLRHHVLALSLQEPWLQPTHVHYTTSIFKTAQLENAVRKVIENFPSSTPFSLSVLSPTGSSLSVPPPPLSLSLSLSLSHSPHSRVLVGNPIECGCCTVWLFDFLTRKNLLGPDCATPTNLRGMPLLRVQMDELCGKPLSIK